MLKRLLLLLAAAQVVLGSAEIKKAADEMKCKGVDINISDEQMMVILECAAELQVMSKADLTPEKMPCFSKCLLEKKGLIDHDGTPHKEKIVNMVDNGLPEALQADVKKHLAQCLDDHGSKVKKDDATCMSFEPLTKCVHDAFIHLCKD